MLMFTAAIAYLMELALIAGGLLLLGKPNKSENKFQKLAGLILLIGAVLALLCTSYFSMKYMAQGGFDQALLLPLTLV